MNRIEVQIIVCTIIWIISSLLRLIKSFKFVQSFICNKKPERLMKHADSLFKLARMKDYVKP